MSVKTISFLGILSGNDLTQYAEIQLDAPCNGEKIVMSGGGSR